MEITEIIYKTLIINGVEISYIALGVFAVAFIAFLVQMYYYLGRYGSLYTFRNNRGVSAEATPPPVSVVVVIRENNYYFVENILPAILNQEYHMFEVIVVDCSYNEEIASMLSDAVEQYPHLHVTAFKAQHNYEHSTKLALTVGIKAARYEHLLFTTADCYPASSKWLSLMAKGFISADVVIGYCGVELRKGVANSLIRSSRLNMSMRYLASAVKGKPYRGMAGNIGYTKSLYFDSKGFNHLNMNVGDDDLFLQKIMSGNNVSIVMNPNAAVCQIAYGGLKWWYSLCRFYGESYRFYPSWVKRYIAGELWSKFIFFCMSAVSIAIMDGWVRYVPVGLMILRSVVVQSKLWRISLRLTGRKVFWAYFLYDLISPVSGMYMGIIRTLRYNKAAWR